MKPHGTVYIVEDDDAVRLALRVLLRSYGWKCQTFGSAEEFLRAPMQERCVCLITDLHMDGMSGADLLESLRATGRNFPVIAITAIADSQLIERVRRCKVEALLIKPFQDEALKSAVEAAIAAA